MTSMLSSTGFTNNQVFNFATAYAAAITGDIEAIKDIRSEFQSHLDDLNKSIRNFAQAEYYIHRANQTAIRQSATNYRDMIKLLNQVIADPKKNLAALGMIKDNRVLLRPHYGAFSLLDQERLLSGMSVKGTRKRGLGNYQMTDYAYLAADEAGILLTFNDEQHLISSETAHSLIANASRRGVAAKARLKKERETLTPEEVKELRKQLHHFQRVPLGDPGVFATDASRASYDGCTMVIGEGEVITTVDGQTVHLPKVRLSMTHKLFAMLFYPVAIRRGLDDTDKYQYHAHVAGMIYGEENDVLPCNEIEIDQLWDACYALVRGSDDTYYWKTDAEQEKCFDAGNTRSYFAIRHITCLEDILDIDTYTECMAQYKLDQIAHKEASELKRQQRKATPVVNEIDEAILADLDEHPF